jgi:hypothetical protein
VAAAYGWPVDLTDEQILERLLALNLERAAEEARAAKARLKSRRRRTESLIKALFSRNFETPYVVSYGNELFFNGPLKPRS